MCDSVYFIKMLQVNFSTIMPPSLLFRHQDLPLKTPYWSATIKNDSVKMKKQKNASGETYLAD